MLDRPAAHPALGALGRDRRSRRDLRVLPGGRGRERLRRVGHLAAGRARRRSASSTAATSTASQQRQIEEYRRDPRRRVRREGGAASTWTRWPRRRWSRARSCSRTASAWAPGRRGRDPRLPSRHPGRLTREGKIDREAWTAIRRARVRERGAASRPRSATTSWRAEGRAADLEATVAVSDAEARDSSASRLEEVEIAYVAGRRRRSSGTLPRWTPPPSTRCSRATPRASGAAYDERQSEFDQPEQVRARHILIAAQPGRGRRRGARRRLEAKAQARGGRGADARRRGLREGGARSSRRTPARRTAGGDLGFFPRGAHGRRHSRTRRSLEPGTVSRPRAEHLRLPRAPRGGEAARRSSSRSTRRSATSRARSRRRSGRQDADELVAKLLEAVGAGKTLVEAARERSVSIERPGPIRRRGDGVIPSLGTSPEALAAIFALTAEKPHDRPRLRGLREARPLRAHGRQAPDRGGARAEPQAGARPAPRAAAHRALERVDRDAPEGARGRGPARLQLRAQRGAARSSFGCGASRRAATLPLHGSPAHR